MAPSDSSAPFGDRLPQRRASGASIVEGPSSRRGSTLSTLSGYSGLPAAVVGDEGDSGPETMRNESITVSSAFPFVAYHSTELASLPAFSRSYRNSLSFSARTTTGFDGIQKGLRFSSLNIEKNSQTV